MKQVTGFIIILLCIPVLILIQDAIIGELNHADTLNEQFTGSFEIVTPSIDVPVTMLDRNGSIFSEEYIEWREPLALSEVPLFAQQLFLESEDSGFYDHKGYDVTAIARAFLFNTSTDELSQGGSTITQQLVRMRFLSTDKTYERKLTELLYAAELEKVSSKNEIFTMYLNEMYFGNQVYGIGAAATYYFSRPLDELNEAEIAFISAIPNNPSTYDPLKHFDRTKKRQELLLDILARNRVITQDEASAYKNIPIELNIKNKENHFPMYSTYVFSELEKLIEEAEGFSEKMEKASSIEEKKQITQDLKQRTSEIISTGIIIETALDQTKQQKDELAVTALLTTEALQAGAVVVDNSRREIVSLYGGKGYQKADFNRAFQAARQPGSAIKPLLVYAPLFENRSYSATTMINSGNICIETYCPKNFGGFVYGEVTIKEAFRHSHNTAAVRLFQTVGIEEAFSYLDPFRFESISRRDMNYPAALGGFTIGVTPLELAGAYTSFIDGQYVPIHAIQSVKDRNGNLLYEWNKEPIEVWSQATTETVRDLLQDVVLNGTARGVPFTTSFTGAKTGTTNQDRDLWTAGLNDQYTAAVWIGFDEPKPIPQPRKQNLHLRIFSILLQE